MLTGAEKSELSYYLLVKGIKYLNNWNALVIFNHPSSNYVPREGLEGVSFIKALRSTVRAGSTSIFEVFWRPGLTEWEMLLLK